MPLRGRVDNEDIISIDLSDEDWDALKRRIKTQESVLTLPCCGQEGFLRVSSKGLKHFVHSKSANPCDWKPESAEHLKAKVAIIEACRENGWKATPEFSEADWRADVLASQGSKRIAFEIQWSKQSYEETKFRQDRYKASNVRGCWFFRTAPRELMNYDKTLIADKAIPAFKVFKDESSNIVAQFEEEQIPLKTLVERLVNRKLKFCNHIRIKSAQEITIVFFEISCWKCHKTQHCYTVLPHLQTVCGRDYEPMGSMWDDGGIDKNPQVYEAVQRFLKTDEGKDLKIGALKLRNSRTAETRYLSHGCYYCDAIFGDFHLHTDKMYACEDSKNIRFTTTIDLGKLLDKQPHWCYSENGDFCE